MYPTETEAPAPKKSRRLLWVGLGAAVLTVLVVVVVALALNGSKKQETATTNEAAQVASVATNEDVKQNLAVLDATLKQAGTDQAAAKAALKDGTSQIKVGN